MTARKKADPADAPGSDDPPAAPPARAKAYKFPKALGACADRLWTLRAERLAIQKTADDLETEEKALKEHLIQTLPKSEAAGVTGKLCNVRIVTKQVPQVKDWPAFYAYVKRTGAFELLGRRLNEKAVAERWEARKVVPGVEAFGAVIVSMTKP